MAHKSISRLIGEAAESWNAYQWELSQGWCKTKKDTAKKKYDEAKKVIVTRFKTLEKKLSDEKAKRRSQ